MNSRDIKAIDVHAHYGLYHRHEFHDLNNQFMTGTAAEVVRRATAQNVEWTVVSPLKGLLPRGEADAAAGNDEAEQVVPATPGLLQWVIIDPKRPATYEQARRALKTVHCVGIKIHGEEHLYHVEDHCDAIFAFAHEHQAVVLAHSGDLYTMPMRFVPFADRYPGMKLILAHLGNCCEKGVDPSHQVRAIAASRHGNVYTDTSSARSILPGLIEWAVKEVGAEKILFGTDTPLYSTSNQRARIDHADLTLDQKRAILRDNATKLLRIPKPARVG